MKVKTKSFGLFGFDGLNLTVHNNLLPAGQKN